MIHFLTVITMIKPLALSAYLMSVTTFAFADLFSNADIWDKIERFGLPTVLLLIVVYFAHRQNEKRMSEQREFWADNNSYLRMLIKETRANNPCKFEK